MARAKRTDLRRRTYELLEQGLAGSLASRIVSRALVLLILINLAAIILESVPDLEARYSKLFLAIEVVSLIVFTVEYFLRLWVAPEHEPHQHLHNGRARFKYALSLAGIVDLLAVLPFWFAPLLPVDARSVLVFRVFRFLKLARYSPGVRSLLDALYDERRALLGCLLILLGATVIAASVMHVAERHAQPDKLGTIPDAMWWAIVTLGTIGYGDVVPVTMLGKVIASFTVFLGLIMVALPVGIVATAFADAIHRREFVVTWGMVARVPLFSGLTAGEIADIMRLLRAQTVEAGAVIARRGEPAHSMYFVWAGEVEIDLASGAKRLSRGHFFGEVAVLRRARRSATITAVSRTSLLVLDAHDFRELLGRQPRIAERLNETVRDRLGRELVSPHGDIVTEELADQEPARAGEPGPAHRRSPPHER
jgi:voltage-gated potassium channel